MSRNWADTDTVSRIGDRTGEIVMDNLTKTYDPDGEHVVAVEDLDLRVAPEEFLTVLGPSGCGKSTLLHLIAGYMDPTEGQILVDDEPVTGPDPSRGVVFQENRLYPWKTIEANVNFGPQMRGEPNEDRTEQLIVDMGLDGFQESYPHELSGGMQQRAEIARLLANDPDIMLLDEPFSALDEMTKEMMHETLLEVWREEHRTAVFITHDVEEAILLGDRAAVMTARPGQFKELVDIDLPRPRDASMTTDDEFVAIKERVVDLIHEEAEKALEQQEA